MLCFCGFEFGDEADACLDGARYGAHYGWGLVWISKGGNVFEKGKERMGMYDEGREGKVSKSQCQQMDDVFRVSWEPSIVERSDGWRINGKRGGPMRRVFGFIPPCRIVLVLEYGHFETR